MSRKVDISRLEPEANVSGEPALKTLAPFAVIVPVEPMVTPPVAAKGVIHSGPAVTASVLLYFNDAPGPYVGAAETVAVPSIERIFVMVGGPVSVFTPELANVRL